MQITVVIPQGSILSHFLSSFVLMIFLQSYLILILISLLTIPSYYDENIDSIKNTMNLDLANIYKWAETNKLIMNTENPVPSYSPLADA